MNKQQLVRTIAHTHKITLYEAEQILNTILKSIRKQLKQGQRVRLRNFGTFQARKSHGKLRAKFDDSENFFKMGWQSFVNMLELKWIQKNKEVIPCLK